MKRNLVFYIYLILMLTACSPGVFANPGQNINPPDEDQSLTTPNNQKVSREPQARAEAVNFYKALNQGFYDQAVNYYGGSFEVLEGYNPLIDPGDKAGLLQSGCQANGLMCLSILDINLIDEKNPHEFVYEVSFANPDGSLFVLGPCCGATEEEMPPVSVFTVNVICEPESTCLVLDLPPYVP